MIDSDTTEGSGEAKPEIQRAPPKQGIGVQLKIEGETM